jgi:GNAT superfamily N-acetyltransferase
VDAGSLRIEPIRARHLGDLDTLFSRGDPRWCQCAYMRRTNLDWNNADPAENREVHSRAVRRAARAGRAAGLIAYDDSDPVGWVSFGPRSEFDRLASSRLLAPIDDQPVWSVVCFVVAARARRQGVASALLDATIEWAAAHDVSILEGYPVDTSGARKPGSELWRGTLSLFQAAGFEIVATRQHNATSPPRPIVRRTL